MGPESGPVSGAFSATKNGPGIRAHFWSLLVLAQLPKAQKTGPFLGPHFGAGKPLLSSFLELQNLDTDREIPSNATSSSLDAAGKVKHPVTACLEHTFAFNSQVETCCIWSYQVQLQLYKDRLQ